MLHVELFSVKLNLLEAEYFYMELQRGNGVERSFVDLVDLSSNFCFFNFLLCFLVFTPQKYMGLSFLFLIATSCVYAKEKKKKLKREKQSLGFSSLQSKRPRKKMSFLQHCHPDPVQQSIHQLYLPILEDIKNWFPKEFSPHSASLTIVYASLKREK